MSFERDLFPGMDEIAQKTAFQMIFEQIVDCQAHSGIETQSPRISSTLRASESADPWHRSILHALRVVAPPRNGFETTKCSVISTMDRQIANQSGRLRIYECLIVANSEGFSCILGGATALGARGNLPGSH